jgi:hypothetical protein
LGGLFDDTYDSNYQNEIDKKIERITSTASKYNITIPENIQNYIDQREERYEDDEGDASYMSSTSQQDLERSVPTPMNTMIEAPKAPVGSVTPTDIDALGTGSAASGRITRGDVSVNPSANPNIVSNIDTASKTQQAGSSAPVIMDNSTKVTNISGGGSGSTGSTQTTGSATRRNPSPQDRVQSRSSPF